MKFRDGIRWIRVENFGSYQYRESLDEATPWKTVICRVQSAMAPSIQLLKRLGTNDNRLSTKKLANLSKQLEYVPVVFRSFYQEVINRKQGNANNSHGNDTDNSDIVQVRQTVAPKPSNAPTKRQNSRKASASKSSDVPVKRQNSREAPTSKPSVQARINIFRCPKHLTSMVPQQSTKSG